MTPKISVITATYNRADMLEDAIRSVQEQSYPLVEHVIVDGGSTDDTLKLVYRLARGTDVVSSEPDNGIYDALNKGLRMATGDILGFMHSDDVYASNNVLSEVARAFEDVSVDAIYGDLDYVSQKDIGRVVRRWRSCSFQPALLQKGWMPPHPTLYLRRHVIEKWGGFDTSFRIAADYDAILRYFGMGRIRAVHLDMVMVKMRLGGESNRSVDRVIKKMAEDLRALKKNGVGGFRSLAHKNFSKLSQFL